MEINQLPEQCQNCPDIIPRINDRHRLEQELAATGFAEQKARIEYELERSDRALRRAVRLTIGCPGTIEITDEVLCKANREPDPQAYF